MFRNWTGERGKNICRLMAPESLLSLISNQIIRIKKNGSTDK
jgi:hypothetical protein